MAGAEPTCFVSIQEGKGAQGITKTSNQKGKAMSRGQKVNKIADYFHACEANLNNRKDINGNTIGKLALVELPKQIDNLSKS